MPVLLPSTCHHLSKDCTDSTLVSVLSRVKVDTYAAG
jgi:hypothetical protein